MAVPVDSNNQISGLVESVNPKGLRLAGCADWVNFSKFSPDLVPPAKGSVVTLTLDRQGFIRAVKTSADSASVSSRQPVGQRDTTITRLAILKAAAEFAAARPQVKSAEVLRIAESWERWVNRPADATDTVDAF